MKLGVASGGELRNDGQGVFIPGPAVELSGFEWILPPLTSRRGVGLEVRGIPRWRLALFVDVYVELLKPVVQVVDLFPWHQGEGMESGVSRGLGGVSLVGPFSTGPEPLDDIDEEQGRGHDEGDGPVREARPVPVGVHVYLDEARARMFPDAGRGGWLGEGDRSAGWCLAHD